MAVSPANLIDNQNSYSTFHKAQVLDTTSELQFHIVIRILCKLTKMALSSSSLVYTCTRTTSVTYSHFRPQCPLNGTLCL